MLRYHRKGMDINNLKRKEGYYGIYDRVGVASQGTQYDGV